MNEINISFKELVDYIRDKDFEIEKLTYNNRKLCSEINEFRNREKAISEYLHERGITLVIKSQRAVELEKEQDNGS